MKLAIIAAVIAMSLSACQKASEAPQPASSNSGAAPARQTQSVATSPNALPPSDASIKPQAAVAPKTSDAQGATQASPKDLSKTEEAAAMPLAGQANNHSTPATTGEKK